MMPTIRIDLSPEDHAFLTHTARVFELSPEQAAGRLLLASADHAKRIVEAVEQAGPPGTC